MGFGDGRALDLLVQAGGNREGLQLDAAEVADLVEELDVKNQVRDLVLDEIYEALERVKLSKAAQAAIDRVLDSLAA